MTKPLTKQLCFLKSPLNYIGGKYKMIAVNKFEQVDVNYPEDFELAVAIERGLPLESEYKTEHI